MPTAIGPQPGRADGASRCGAREVHGMNMHTRELSAELGGNSSSLSDLSSVLYVKARGLNFRNDLT